jgi:hypothetical protein
MTDYEVPEIFKILWHLVNLLKSQTFMSQHDLPQFVDFLHQELCIPHKSIQVATENR